MASGALFLSLLTVIFGLIAGTPTSCWCRWCRSSTFSSTRGGFFCMLLLLYARASPLLAHLNCIVPYPLCDCSHGTVFLFRHVFPDSSPHLSLVTFYVVSYVLCFKVVWLTESSKASSRIRGASLFICVPKMYLHNIFMEEQI